MNDFGYFQNDGEYVIHNWNLPRPWMNYLWNHRFLSAVNQFGGGDGAYGGRTACYIDEENRGRSSPVSYTHLDVYKRQYGWCKRDSVRYRHIGDDDNCILCGFSAYRVKNYYPPAWSAGGENQLCPWR